jgi:hypothetical protein
MSIDKEIDDTGKELRNFYKNLENEARERLVAQMKVNFELAKFFKDKGDYNQMAIYYSSAVAVQLFLDAMKKEN